MNRESLVNSVDSNNLDSRRSCRFCQQARRQQHQGWLICLVAALFYCYEYLLRIMPSVMVDELAQAFQASATQIGVISACFYFVYTPMQLVVGLLADYFGSRRVMLFAIVTCLLGNLLFGYASNIQLACGGRALIGLGAAFAFVGAVKLAAAWLAPHLVNLFVGITTALGMAGAMLQTNLLPQLMQTLTWQQAVNLGTLMGLGLLLLALLFLRDQPASSMPSAPDANGVVDRPCPRPHSVALSFTMVWHNLLQIMATAQIWVSGLVAGILYLSLSMVAELWGIPLLSELYQLSTAQAAVSCSMIYLGWLVGSPLAGYLSAYFSARKMLLAGLALSCWLIVLLIYFSSLFSLTGCRVALFLFGIASSVEVLCFELSNRQAPRGAVATATAFTNCLVMLGGFITQPLIGALLDMLRTNRSSGVASLAVSYSVLDYRFAFLILPLLLLAGLVLVARKIK